MNVLAFNTIADHIKKLIYQECGLNLSQTRILLYFNKNSNQSISMGNLAKELNISLSTLSRQLQQKQTKKYIQISRSGNDSSKNIKLSDDGINQLSILKASLTRIQNQLFYPWDQTKITNFTIELNNLVSNC